MNAWIDSPTLGISHTTGLSPKDSPSLPLRARGAPEPPAAHTSVSADSSLEDNPERSFAFRNRQAGTTPTRPAPAASSSTKTPCMASPTVGTDFLMTLVAFTRDAGSAALVSAARRTDRRKAGVLRPEPPTANRQGVPTATPAEHDARQDAERR